jgi:putative ABC transport system ATP-binding protein
MAKPIIYADNIEITYNLGKSNEFKANRGTTVEIFPHEYIILFGPSGCGKSTLLYSMFGVLRPSKGKMWVKGESIYDYSPMEMVQYQRKIMGIMYQQFNLIPSISVLDNVALPLIFAGVGTKEREEKAMELCRRFMLDKVTTKRPPLLSGGQQQRVSVARSLVNDPEILIADEPVGNLDSITAAQVLDTLAEINSKDKKTVILVTHDAKYLPYAHRVVYMADGKIVRIVPNPEKRQIIMPPPGSTIITEIEQLSRIYPYDSPAELQVKSVVNFITQNITYDQILRLEKMTEQVINGRMNQDAYLRLLMLEYEKGGAGIDVSQASAMSARVEKVLEHGRDIARFRRMIAGVTGIPKTQYVERLEQFLIEENQLTLTQTQRQHLNEAIEYRIGGFTKKEDFFNQLTLEVSAGGIGLSYKQTTEATRLLEKLIAQGVMHIGSAHH